VTRGRVMLLAFGIGALVLILSPALVFWNVQPTLCPTVITAQGRVENGLVWEFTRSDCPGGRTVWQVRVAPLQGVLRLAYDAEGGPEPEAVAQSGRIVTIRLKAPLRDGTTSVRVELDPRARPTAPARVRDNAVVSEPATPPRGRDMAALPAL
jgi:hypothetical protein